MDINELREQVSKKCKMLGAISVMARKSGISKRRLLIFMDGRDNLTEIEIHYLTKTLEEMEEYNPLREGYVSKEIRNELKEMFPRVGGNVGLANLLGLSVTHTRQAVYAGTKNRADVGEKIYHALYKTNLRERVKKMPYDPDWRVRKREKDNFGTDRTYKEIVAEELERRKKMIAEHNKKRCVLSVGDRIEFMNQIYISSAIKTKCEIIQEFDDYYLGLSDMGYKVTILKNNLICGDEEWRRL